MSARPDSDPSPSSSPADANADADADAEAPAPVPDPAPTSSLRYRHVSSSLNAPPPPSTSPTTTATSTTTEPSAATATATANATTPQPPSLRDRAVAAATGVGLVTAALGGTYLLSDADALFPIAIAAAVATISSLVLRYVLVSLQHTQPHGRLRHRHLRHHRHFTGERAEYVRASQRLAMIDRDFTAADYELLLDLDNHSQRLRRFLEGASEDTVSRLPTHIYRSPKPAAAASNTPACPCPADNSDCPAAAAGDDTPTPVPQSPQTPTPDHDNDNEDDDDDALTSASLHDAPHTDESPDMDESLFGTTAKQCMICLEEFQDGMTIRTLPCFHRFMADCIDSWLVQQAKCPLCKRSIQEDMTSLPPGVL